MTKNWFFAFLVKLLFLAAVFMAAWSFFHFGFSIPEKMAAGWSMIVWLFAYVLCFGRNRDPKTGKETGPWSFRPHWIAYFLVFLALLIYGCYRLVMWLNQNIPVDPVVTVPVLIVLIALTLALLIRERSASR